MELLHKDLTDRILKTYFEVYNELGYGFLEKVYQNAMFLELRNKGFSVAAQQQIKVYYKGYNVGEYYADLTVDHTVILELKAAETLVKDFEYQLINYLRATNMEVGLLLNFGPKPEFRRKVFSNDRKNLPKPFSVVIRVCASISVIGIPTAVKKNADNTDLQTLITADLRTA